MTTPQYRSALALADEGFHVFPLKPNSKTPAHKGWKDEATRDYAAIHGWFENSDFNIGIFTEKFGDGEALLVLDVDTTKGKNGHADLVALELEGHDLPDTRTHDTPTGGRHLLFRVGTPVRQSAGKIGKGLDIRSRGGFIVGPGSKVPAGEYAVGDASPIVPAPEWLVGRCGESVRRDDRPQDPQGIQAPPATANPRAVRYLGTDAPLAIEGAAGDETTYKVAARLKDFGVPCDEAVDLMAEHWNERCQPPWPLDELRAKVRNAYAYGQNPVGAAAPERDFTPFVEPTPEAPKEELGSPYAELNKEYAFVMAGGGCHILFETVDHHNRASIEHLSMEAFHKKFAAKKMSVGKRTVPLTQEWLEWDGRRSYDGIVFMPGAPRDFIVGEQ